MWRKNEKIVFKNCQIFSSSKVIYEL